MKVFLQNNLSISSTNFKLFISQFFSYLFLTGLLYLFSVIFLRSCSFIGWTIRDPLGLIGISAVDLSIIFKEKTEDLRIEIIDSLDRLRITEKSRQYVH
jgi:ABC-type uncharacterized transport system permease subunit